MKEKSWHDETDPELINFLLATILKDEDNLTNETRKEIADLMEGKI